MHQWRHNIGGLWVDAVGLENGQVRSGKRGAFSLGGSCTNQNERAARGIKQRSFRPRTEALGFPPFKGPPWSQSDRDGAMYHVSTISTTQPSHKVSYFRPFCLMPFLQHDLQDRPNTRQDAESNVRLLRGILYGPDIPSCLQGQLQTSLTVIPNVTQPRVDGSVQTLEYNGTQPCQAPSVIDVNRDFLTCYTVTPYWNRASCVCHPQTTQCAATYGYIRRI